MKERGNRGENPVEEMQRGGSFTTEISVLDQEAFARNQNSFLCLVKPLRNLQRNKLVFKQKQKLRKFGTSSLKIKHQAN